MLLSNRSRLQYQLKQNLANKRIFRKTISRRNVNLNITNNPPSTYLVNHFQFRSYCQKYINSRRQFLVEPSSLIGLGRDSLASTFYVIHRIVTVVVDSPVQLTLGLYGMEIEGHCSSHFASRTHGCARLHFWECIHGNFQSDKFISI